MGKFNLLTTLSLNASGLSEGLKNSIRDVENYVNSTESKNKTLTSSFRDVSQMGIGEIKKELVSLSKISFAGKTEEEIQTIKQRMGDLKDTMGDLRSEMEVMGGPGIGAVIGGFEFLSAGIEGSSAALSVFGVDSEVVKSLEGKMTSLIAVTHALGVAEDYVNSGKLRAIGLKLRDMTATVSNTIATKAAAVAQLELNAAMSASLYGAAALAVAGLVAGIVYLVNAESEATEAARRHYEEVKRLNEISFENRKRAEETAESAYKSYIKQQLHVEKLVKTILDEGTSQKEYNKAVKELNSLDPTYISNQDRKTLSTQQGKEAIKEYLQALKRKAEAEALESTLTDVYIQKFQKQQQIKNLERGKEVYQIQKTALEKAIADDTELDHYYENYTALQAKNKQIEDQSGLINNLSLELNNYDRIISAITLDIDKNTGAVEFNISASDKSSKAKEAEATTYAKLNKEIGDLTDKIREYVTLGKDASSLVVQLQVKQAQKKSIDNTTENLISPALALTLPDPEATEKQILALAEQVVYKLEKDLKPIELKLAPIPQDSMKGVLEQVGALSGTLSSFFDQQSGEYKAFATAQASMSTYLAAVQVMANQAKLGPIAMGIAFTGTIATGLAAVAKIQGFAEGGIIGGQSFTGDKVLARVNSKEMVLTQRQQAQLFALANGNSEYSAAQEVVFRIEDSTLVGILNRYNKRVKSMTGR